MPIPTTLYGDCRFVGGVNCKSDRECSGLQKCCREGCNKICKPPRPTFVKTRFASVKTLSLEEEEQAVKEILETHHLGRSLLSGLQRVFKQQGLENDPAWLPDFLATNRKADGNWELILTNTKSENAQRSVTIGQEDPPFLRALEFIKTQGQLLQAAFQVDPSTGLLKQKDGVSISTTQDGLAALTRLQIFQVALHIVKAAELAFAQAMDAFAWASAHNLLKMAGALYSGTYGFIALARNAFLLTAKGAVVGEIIPVLAIAYDIYTLEQAIVNGDYNAIVKAAAALTTDVIAAAVGFAGTIAGIVGGAVGITVSAVASALAVPLAGIAIGIGALVQQALENIQSAEEALKYLGDVYNAYHEYKGYVLDSNGTMIPQIDANIEVVNFREKTIKFGETKLRGNANEIPTPLRATNTWIDYRKETGASEDFVPLNEGDKKSILMVLPQGGNINVETSVKFTFVSFGSRYDWQLYMLQPLRDRNLYYFYSSYAVMAACCVTIQYENKRTQIVLDNKKHVTMVMPPKKAFRPEGNSWDLTYQLNGNGGDYTLVVNPKTRGNSYVEIIEDAPTASNWVLLPGEGESSIISGLKPREAGFEFYMGNVWFNVKQARSKVVVISEDLLFTVDVKGKTFLGVSEEWYKKQPRQNLFNALENVSKQQGVDQFVVFGIPYIWYPGPRLPPYETTTGIYSVTEKHIRANLERGFIRLWSNVETPIDDNLPLWGVRQAYFGWDPEAWFDELSVLGEKEVHLQDIRLPQLGDITISGLYTALDGKILGTTENGRMYRISRDFRAEVVGLYVQSLDESFQEIVKSILQNDKFFLSPLVTVFIEDKALMWYDSVEKIAIFAPSGYHYVGKLDDLHILFNPQAGAEGIYSQVSAQGHQYSTPKLIYQNLGTPKKVYQKGSSILVETTEDLTFRLFNAAEQSGELIKTGPSNPLSWDEIYARVNAGKYKLSELIYSNSSDGSSYWFYTSTKSRFSPTQEMLAEDSDISNYEYLGYWGSMRTWNKPVIYLYNAAQYSLYALSADGSLLRRTVKDAIRIGRTLGIEFDKWDAYEADPQKRIELAMNGVETLVFTVTLYDGQSHYMFWPDQFGFQKTIFQAPLDYHVGSVHAYVPRGSNYRRTGLVFNDLEVSNAATTKKLIFEDVPSTPKLYSSIVIMYSSGDPAGTVLDLWKPNTEVAVVLKTGLCDSYLSDGDDGVGISHETPSHNGQIWVLFPTSDGYYQLKSRTKYTCLEVNGGGFEDGAIVDLWPCSEGAKNLEWKIVQVTLQDGVGDVVLVNRRSGKCLTVEANTSLPRWQDSSHTVQAECVSPTQRSNQTWTIETAPASA